MFAIEPSTEIAHRTDFNLLCNARAYVDAVEVGVDQAVFARDFMTRFNGNWLFLVDAWEPYDETPYDRRGDLALAVNAMTPYHGRVRFVRGRSTDVARWITRVIRPDFVYIDASHFEQDVAEDLAAWYPQLTKTGMIAGHDFDKGHPGVMRAVERFARQHDLTVRLTHERAAPASWYCYRTEPATLHQYLFTTGERPNPRNHA